MATTTEREYGVAVSMNMAHIVKRWKPNPNGYIVKPYVTMCGTAGASQWRYTDETIGEWKICPKCEAKSYR